MSIDDYFDLDDDDDFRLFAKRLQELANKVIEMNLSETPVPSAINIHNDVRDTLALWAKSHNYSCVVEKGVKYLSLNNKTNIVREEYGLIDLVIGDIPIEIDSSYRRKSIDKLLSYDSLRAIWLYAESEKLNDKISKINCKKEIAFLPILPYKTLSRNRRKCLE